MINTLNKIGLASFALALSTNAAIVAGFDQRYASGDYSGGVWTDSAGSADATANNAAGFLATTTPNGSAALANVTTGGNDGDVLAFTRGSELGSAGELTVQSVIRIDGTSDNRSGPYALDQTSGWGGLYAGSNADGGNDLRGGNVGNTGSNSSIINGSGGSAVTVGTWGIYTLTVDAATAELTATFTDLATGLDLFTDTITGPTTGAGSTLGFSNAGVLFGGEQGGGASATNGTQIAIADVVVYNSVLSSTDIATNIGEFQTLYQIPEPSSFGLLGLALGAGFLRRKRN